MKSGYGQSTLARLLARLIDPICGSIHFEGQDLLRVPAYCFAYNSQHQRVQQMFQDATESLNPRITAVQTIADSVQRLIQ